VKAFADLKADLEEEKATRLSAQIEAYVLSRAVRDLKMYTDRFAGHIPTLEDQVKNLENKVVDGLNEVRARELCLERTTQDNGDYQKQVTQLTEKLESKFFDCILSVPLFMNHFPTDLASIHRIRCRA
jgi:predicted  nucleic acid-binding Zn-ribbon protein